MNERVPLLIIYSNNKLIGYRSSWKRKQERKWCTQISQQQTRASGNLAHFLLLGEVSRGECSCLCLEKLSTDSATQFCSAQVSHSPDL